ncbi:MAG: hypothetical protein ACK5PS_08365 [Desulfopila sp.]
MKKRFVESCRSRWGVSVLLLLTALVVSSCSAKTRLLSSWVDPGVSETDWKIEDALVIGVSRDATTRRLFENSYARGLQRHGVRAVTGDTVDAVRNTITYDTVVQAAESTGVKAVLVTRLKDASTRSVTSDSLGQMYSIFADEPIADGPLINPGPSSTTTRVQWQVESMLYEVKTKKLLWSGVLELADPVMTNRYIDSATRYFIDDLQEKGLI